MGGGCPVCGATTKDGARFCPNCATPLLDIAVCGGCNAEQPQGDRFCQCCGRAFDAPRPTMTNRAQQAEMAEEPWEYRHTYISVDAGDKGQHYSFDAVNRRLEEFGSVGWELVDMEPDHVWSTRTYGVGFLGRMIDQSRHAVESATAFPAYIDGWYCTFRRRGHPARQHLAQRDEALGEEQAMLRSREEAERERQWQEQLVADRQYNPYNPAMLTGLAGKTAPTTGSAAPDGQQLPACAEREDHKWQYIFFSKSWRCERCGALTQVNPES
jgi:hypothetical protein